MEHVRWVCLAVGVFHPGRVSVIVGAMAAERVEVILGPFSFWSPILAHLLIVRPSRSDRCRLRVPAGQALPALPPAESSRLKW